MNKNYYISMTTGEIAFGEKHLVKIFFSDLLRHHFLNINWKPYDFETGRVID